MAKPQSKKQKQQTHEQPFVDDPDKDSPTHAPESGEPGESGRTHEPTMNRSGEPGGEQRVDDPEEGD